MPLRTQLNTYLRELAKRYATELQRALGDQLVSVVLFGSAARGEAGPTSDIDLFVVLEDAPQGMTKRRALLEPARQALTPELERLWAQDIFVDFVEIIRTKQEARQFHPVYLDMTEEAVLLYDKNNFIADILKQLKQRLQALGAQRKRFGRKWYWDLKPDFKPGEVIEL